MADLTRRRFLSLGALFIAAPVIVRAASLMPVKVHDLDSDFSTENVRFNATDRFSRTFGNPNAPRYEFDENGNLFLVRPKPLLAGDGTPLADKRFVADAGHFERTNAPVPLWRKPGISRLGHDNPAFDVADDCADKILTVLGIPA